MARQKSQYFNRIISKFPLLLIITKIKKNGIRNTLTNIKGYYSIKRNHLFNSEYYLKNNPDVKRSRINPLIHYINHGYTEGRNPNPEFDNEYYLKKYKDVRYSKLNPLVHYSLYGMKEGRETKKCISNFNNQEIDDIIDALGSEQKISIIIPIYNAFEETKKCINSVLTKTKIPYELILIDDNSTDERIGILLNEIENLHNVIIIRNSENKGFVKNINLGIQISSGDVVLLNSDTIVTPKWLSKLVTAAYSDKRIGTVTPLTNASSVSVPIMGENNEIPKPLTIDDMALLVEKASENVYINSPTGNGFCMYIKRKTLNDVGLFDEENFGKGYGEENDFCMRALYKNWKNIYDDSTFIYHKRSVSFDDNYKNKDKIKLKRENQIKLEKKHPSYIKKVKKFFKSKELRNISDYIQYELKKIEENGLCKKRILYVVHRGGGGTQFTNKDLMKHVQNVLDCFILVSNAEEVILSRYKNNKFEVISTWKIKSKWSAKNFYNDEFRNIYFNVLTALKIDIIHIRHLIQHTFDLPLIAEKLEIPVIFSFHDFYLICPSYNLLDDKNNYCAGNCTEGNEQCKIPMAILNDLPILRSFIPKWRMHVSNILSKASAFVTTSEIVKKIFISIYPQLSNEEFEVIEHGRDFRKINKTAAYYDEPSKNQPTKILFPGDIRNHKGAEFIKQLKMEDKDSKLEFHFMGALNEDLMNCGIYHGHYKRNNFCRIVRKIKPSFIGIFSIWPETYCHTLSEAWSCGVPVLATKIGVLEERVNKNKGGWLLNYQNPTDAYEKILRIINSNDEYLNVVENVNKISFKSTEDMAKDYLKLYNKFL